MLKSSIVIAIALLCLVGLYLTPVGQYARDLEHLEELLERAGFWAPLGFVLGGALLAGVGFPKTLCCALAGGTFGFVKGLPLALVATLLGSYGAFLFARWGRPRLSSERLQRFRKFDRWLQRRPALTVGLIRMTPVSGFAASLFLGWTSVGHTPFLIGSFFGFLPMAISATLLGKGAVQPSTSEALPLLLVGSGLFAISVLIGLSLLRRRDVE